jgi:probable rRNA maturation factor
MLHISATAKKDVPKGASFFNDVSDRILGKDYELSLVFVGNSLSRKLNKSHRNIDKPTDILSFTLDKTAGEIFINLPYAKRKCKKFDRNFSNYVKFIFIHGCFHLKGFEHGSRMDSEELKIQKEFNV